MDQKGEIMKYGKASDMLPKSLIAEIHKHFKGGLLWIPVTADQNDERNELIVKLVDRGEPVADVAKLVGVTPRWIREIVRLRKAESAGKQN